MISKLYNYSYCPSNNLSLTLTDHDLEFQSGTNLILGDTALH